MTASGPLTITTPTDREIAITRTFDAPRPLVWKAYTTPELVRRWLGVFGDWSMAVCEIDLRVGGAYRYVWQKPGGRSMGMGGVYREIVEPERLVATERFDEPWYPGVAVATSTFAEEAGRTTLTMSIRYDSKEIRDGVLASPMDKGLSASFDALDDILAA